MEYTILAADDEKELLDALELYLASENIRFLKAGDGLEAIALFRAQEVHLLLLDIMMPGLDGFGVLREIRKTSHVPAIMLSARDQDHDKILGLELGADDYIAKPFNPLEVVARVKAQLRRSYNYYVPETIATQTPPLEMHGLVLDRQEGRLTKEDREILLTSTEMKILHLLMQHPGRIFTKQQIYESVWDDYYTGSDSAILVHISNLRSKIETDPRQPRILKNIKGLGYKIERPDSYEA